MSDYKSVLSYMFDKDYKDIFKITVSLNAEMFFDFSLPAINLIKV